MPSFFSVKDRKRIHAAISGAAGHVSGMPDSTRSPARSGIVLGLHRVVAAAPPTKPPVSWNWPRHVVMRRRGHIVFAHRFLRKLAICVRTTLSRCKTCTCRPPFSRAAKPTTIGHVLRLGHPEVHFNKQWPLSYGGMHKKKPLTITSLDDINDLLKERNS